MIADPEHGTTWGLKNGEPEYCGGCRFYLTKHDVISQGVCRRYAPRQVLDGLSLIAQAFFTSAGLSNSDELKKSFERLSNSRFETPTFSHPAVEADGWCGEFEHEENEGQRVEYYAVADEFVGSGGLRPCGDPKPEAQSFNVTSPALAGFETRAKIAIDWMHLQSLPAVATKRCVSSGYIRSELIMLAQAVRGDPSVPKLRVKGHVAALVRNGVEPAEFLRLFTERYTVRVAP